MIKTKRILEFTDTEKINISFSCLIINVESVNKKFGLLDDFVNEYELWGETNGKILCLSEMRQPAGELYELVDRILYPLGFKNKTDYVIAYERMTKGSDKTENPPVEIEIPECKDVKWLESYINAVWFKNPQKINENFKELA